MKTLEVKILSDRTDTGGFGVEGYEIKLTSKRWSIKAFVNIVYLTILHILLSLLKRLILLCKRLF